MEAVNFVTDNWVAILTAITSTVTAFSLIAKITPTPKDDAIAAKLVKFIDFVALNTQRDKK